MYQFLTSTVFLSAFFSWFMAQLLKLIIEALRNRSQVSRDVAIGLMWRTGGMPSSHSALVTSIATAIAFSRGVNNPLFTLSLFYGMLVIRDALGVRRAAGMQARELNRLGTELNRSYNIDFTPVQEVHGHTPSEVSVGVLLGFFIATAFSLL
ncbi:MAG: divergent PAP2 family protein [Spirochaetes bacterium]|jgi:acid phosphatase family membrane protein YuiD|nr:divergent PAP2 family protein [Spirochaetota bacterium]